MYEIDLKNSKVDQSISLLFHICYLAKKQSWLKLSAAHLGMGSGQRQWDGSAMWDY